MENFVPENSPHFIGKMAASTEDDAPEHWVGGDGGPLIILQASAAVQWQGALGSEDDVGDNDEDIVAIDAHDAHLYAADEIAYSTDLDTAFLGGNYIIRRYDRDMLVLEDSEWTGRLFVLPSGAVGVVQVQCIVENLPEVIRQATQSEPEHSGVFEMQDDSLRLMVGADTGTDSSYRYLDVPFAPGVKRWKRYEFELGWIYIVE